MFLHADKAHTDKCCDIRKEILFQAVAGIIENSCSILFMLVLADLTDFILQGDAEHFGQGAWLAAVLMIFQAAMSCLEYQFAYRCEAACGKWLRSRVYQGLLYRRREEIDRPGVLNTYNTSIGALQTYCSSIADYFVLCATIVAASAAMLRINTTLLFGSVLLIPFAGYLGRRVNNVLQRKEEVIVRSRENINYNTKQILDGFYSIKAYGMEDRFTAILTRDTEKLAKLEKEMDRVESIQGRLSIALQYLPKLAMLLLGGWMCLCGRLTVGQLLAANTVIWYIVSPAQSLLELLKNRRLLQPKQQKVRAQMMQADAKDSVMTGNISSKSVRTNTAADKPVITFQNVSFSYDGQRRVLDDVSLDIRKGEHVLLAGRSGEGKSTLVKLLCGQCTPDSGRAQTDGKIVFIPQEPYLFSGTLRENICLGSAVGESRLRQIVDAAGLEAFVNAQKYGLDTRIGEEGTSVSGGQRRRIALARAMAQDAAVYVLDEPFSELDSETSASVQDRMSRVLSDRAVVMISHQDITDWHHAYTTYHIGGGKLCYE